MVRNWFNLKVGKLIELYNTINLESGAFSDKKVADGEQGKVDS